MDDLDIEVRDAVDPNILDPESTAIITIAMCAWARLQDLEMKKQGYDTGIWTPLTSEEEHMYGSLVRWYNAIGQDKRDQLRIVAHKAALEILHGGF